MQPRHRYLRSFVLVAAVALSSAACGSDDEPATAAKLPDDLCALVTTTPLPGWTFEVDSSETTGDGRQRAATCAMSDSAGSTLSVSASSYGDSGERSAEDLAAASYDQECTALALGGQGKSQRDDRTCELATVRNPSGKVGASGVFNLGFLPGIGKVVVSTTDDRGSDALTLVKSIRLSMVAELS